jgi:hypothetical protein
LTMKRVDLPPKKWTQRKVSDKIVTGQKMEVSNGSRKKRKT